MVTFVTSEQLSVRLKQIADEIGATLWSGIPTGGPTVFWPNDSAEEFLEAAKRFGPTVIYFSEAGDALCVSFAGVLHTYDPGRLVRRGVDDHAGVELMGGFGGSSIDLSVFEDELDDELSSELRALAEQVAIAPSFDGRNADDVLDELSPDLDPALHDPVSWEARRLFDLGVGRALSRDARKLVRKLVSHASFDPLSFDPRDMEAHIFIDEAISGLDPRLARMVRHGLQQEIWEKGLRDKAEREVKARAAELRQTIPKLTLDQVGFATRTLTREALLEPFLQSEPEGRRSLTGQWIHRLEDGSSALERERRYAFAAKLLLNGPHTKAKVAGQLSVTPTTLDRLLAIRLPSDFVLAPNDPIVVEVAPELIEQIGN